MYTYNTETSRAGSPGAAFWLSCWFLPHSGAATAWEIREAQEREFMALVLVFLRLGLVKEHPQKERRQRSHYREHQIAQVRAEHLKDETRAARAERGGDTAQRTQCASRKIEAPCAGRQVGDDDHREDADHRAGNATEDLSKYQRRIGRRGPGRVRVPA